MEMMAESFRYAAPVAKAYGISIERLAALIGTLGNAGIQGSMAGTQLAFGFQKAARVFKELGMDGAGKDMVDALEAANKAGWDSAKMMQVFGMRGGRAALVLRNLIPKIKEFEATLMDSSGEAKKLADVMRGTVSFAFKELKSAIEGIAIEAFTEKQSNLGEAIKGVTEAIRDNKDGLVKLATGVVNFVSDAGRLISWFARINEESKKFTKWMDDFQKMGGRMASQDKGLIDLAQAMARSQTEGMPSSTDAKERLADLRASLSVVEFQLSVARSLLSITGKSIEAEAKISDLNKKKKLILDGIATTEKDVANQILLAKIHTQQWGNNLDETQKKLLGIVKVDPKEMMGNLKNAFQQERLWESVTVTPRVDLNLENAFKEVDEVDDVLQSLIKKTPLKKPITLEVLVEAQKLKAAYDNIKKIDDALSSAEKMAAKFSETFEDSLIQPIPLDVALKESPKILEDMENLRNALLLPGTEEFFSLDEMFEFEEGELQKRLDEIKKTWEDHDDYLILISERTANALEQNFSDFFFDAMQGEMKSFEDYMVGIFDSISRAFSDILGQMLAEWIKTQLAMKSVAASGSGFGSLFGAVMGLFGGGVGGPGPVVSGGNPADFLPSAKGNIIPFSRGGVVDRPTIFPFASGVGLMSESGPEAIMPLTRTGSGELGVKAEGSGSKETHNYFYINAIDPASFDEILDRNAESVVKRVTDAADAGHGGLRQSMRDIIK
jgi:hypothetical protein